VNFRTGGPVSDTSAGRTVRSSRFGEAVLVLVLLGTASMASGQVVNPATPTSEPSGTEAPPSERPHSWTAPPVNVYGTVKLSEEELIGDYAQPRWTAARRFSETRVYVIPKGQADFEYWLIPVIPKGGGPADFKSQYEVEFGLPGRFQLDLYAVAHKTGTKDGTFAIDEQKVEVRYALADWGKLWGNPTFYLEWNQVSAAPDHVEAKLLLGGEITSGWHWGSNFVWEHEIAGEQENANEWTTGISYTVRDSRFSVGAESQLALVNALDSAGRRGSFSKGFVIGPSLQFRPLPQMHIDFAPLVGVTDSSPRMKTFVVLGWEF
jgi:hypothetical protein